VRVALLLVVAVAVVLLVRVPLLKVPLESVPLVAEVVLPVPVVVLVVAVVVRVTLLLALVLVSVTVLLVYVSLPVRLKLLLVGVVAVVLLLTVSVVPVVLPVDAVAVLVTLLLVTEVVLVAVPVLGILYQTRVEFPLSQVTLLVNIKIASKPICVMTPFVEMMGYLPLPSKLLYPSLTLTNCPTLLSQKPSKSVERKSVRFPPTFFLCWVTVTPVELISPEVADAMPGTETTLLTMVSLRELLGLLIAAWASLRFTFCRAIVDSTAMEPESSETATVDGSITIPSACDISDAIDCCTAKMNEALRSSSAMSES
jgi:hypothetical protein